MKQPIFNSLGSNYSSEVVKLASKNVRDPFRDDDHVLSRLEEELERRFDGVALLVYKGRDAIELALKAVMHFGASKKHIAPAVLTQGLACHAIEEGILRAGYKPVYVDLEKQTLGPSVRTLEEGLRDAKAHGLEVQAVFIQHTLGYANPVPEIRRFCDRYGLVLIEDLAQSFGAQDAAGNVLGSQADIVICSFGRDKVIDAVSGGAVIVKHKSFRVPHREVLGWKSGVAPTAFPPKSIARKEMIYPRLTEWIRSTHAIGLGKLLFQLAKSLRLLTSPIASPTQQTTALPASYARLVLWQLEHLEKQLAHRRQIARIYGEALADVPGAQCLARVDELDRDIHLRVPLLFDDPTAMSAVINACQAERIYISDRWYRSVVDSGSLNYATRYQQKSCPVAEYTASRVLNLPTHRYITVQDAQRIVRVIRQVLER